MKVILSSIILLACLSVEAQPLPYQRAILGRRVRQQQEVQATQTEEVGYGVVGATTYSDQAGLYHTTGKFTAGHSGNITLVSIYSANSNAEQDIKIGIYSDNAGSPAILIGSHEFINIGTWSAGWKEFSVSFPVQAGSTYWFAHVVSTTGLTLYYDGGGIKTHYYKFLAYASCLESESTGTIVNGTKYSVKGELTY